MLRKAFLALIFTYFVFPGCSESGDQGKNSTGNVEVYPVISVKAVTGSAVPEFNWKNAAGKTVSFKEFADGKPVLINFWATWCPPCKKELPDLVALSKELTGKVLFLGISVDRDGDVVPMLKKFMKNNNISYPVIVDNGELSRAFGGIEGIPTTFFVSAEGKIVSSAVGMRSKSEFEAELKKL